MGCGLLYKLMMFRQAVIIFFDLRIYYYFYKEKRNTVHDIEWVPLIIQT